MTDALQGVAPQRSRLHRARADCLADMARLHATDLLEVEFDVFEAATTALFALPLLHLLRPFIIHIGALNGAMLDRIECYALTAAHLDFRCRALEGEDVAVLHSGALVYQHKLCSAADLLPAELCTITPDALKLENVGAELVTRAVRAQRHLAPHLPEAKHLEPLYRTALEAELHGELLLTCLHPQRDDCLGRLENELARAFTLLLHAYEPASAAVRKLSKQRSQIDALARSVAPSEVAEGMEPEALRFFEPGRERSGAN